MPPIYYVIAISIAFFIFVFSCKAYALWLAARRKEKWWFIVLFILQTFAILDIIYIFFIAKNNPEASEIPPPKP